MQQQPKKVKKPKPTIPLLELLAKNSTAGSRALLKKYGFEDATGYDDLKLRLASMYNQAKDKIEIEKDFAEIHPHKELILKYLVPPVPPTKVIVPEPVAAADGVTMPTVSNELTKDDKLLISALAIVGIVAMVIYTKKSV